MLADIRQAHDEDLGDGPVVFDRAAGTRLRPGDAEQAAVDQPLKMVVQLGQGQSELAGEVPELALLAGAGEEQPRPQDMLQGGSLGPCGLVSSTLCVPFQSNQSFGYGLA